MQSGAGFSFGENWASFSESLSEQQLEEARESLQQLLGGYSLEGKSFLDIGCGSGVFSIAAAQLGASPVMGIDLDPVSVRTSQENAKRWAADIPITFQEASVLDDATMESLGVFDVVYSWGVLHHTGDMQKAVKNAAERVRPEGLFVIAIYNRHWSSPLWSVIKRLYNGLPAVGQRFLVWFFAPIIVAAKALATGKNPFRERRGMDFYHNLIDWLGGYPYEYASIEEMRGMLEALGFHVERVIPSPVPTGCNEYVCWREN